MKIDINVRKTEAEWQEFFDRFWLKAAPQWFQWLAWILIIASLSFLDQSYHLRTVSIAKWISYMLLFMYFQSFFYSITFKVWSFDKPVYARIVSVLISGILWAATWIFITKLVTEIKGKT